MILPTLILSSLLVSRQEPIQVRLIVDEAKAALAILNERDQGQTVDWNPLFATEGYKRLKDREAGMGRSFTDDDFKTFMLSEDLLKRREALTKTLADWQKVDVAACAHRSLAYLPESAKLRASVYLLIKPRPNSFVWQIRENPAVMLYLDPEMSSDELSMTIAHEFHHIGFESCCPSKEFVTWRDAQPTARQTALMWQGAFGEGFAVLAAAGGPSPKPVGAGREPVRKAWEEGMAHLDENMADLQKFFLDVLDGKLDEKAAQQKAVTYYGVQGPWYTVGYHMATTIEREFGRKRLVECYLDPRKLLPLYNAAAAKVKSFVWSKELLEKMGVAPPR